MPTRRHFIGGVLAATAANVQDDAPAVTVDVVLSCDRSGTKPADVLREPVLVDPLTQAVYALRDVERPARPGQYRAAFRFWKMPCLDYPLLITDKSALP